MIVGNDAFLPETARDRNHATDFGQSGDFTREIGEDNALELVGMHALHGGIESSLSLKGTANTYGF